MISAHLMKPVSTSKGNNKQGGAFQTNTNSKCMWWLLILYFTMWWVLSLYITFFFSSNFSEAKLDAAGISLGPHPTVNLYKWVPGPTMKVTWWKSSLYVGFLRGSATSKDKFHCRKRKATIPLRNQLQQILAPSQLMEDFLMLFKTACFSNIQALFFHLPFKTVFS